jgi:hypothetical protein
MTVRVLQSRASPKGRLKAQIEIARRMVWQAEFIGWRALHASWLATLRQLEAKK